MREEFKEELQEYNKRLINIEDLEKLDTEHLNKDLHSLVVDTAHVEQTPVKAQKKILELQKEKQFLVRNMQEQIAGVDNPEYNPKREQGTRLVVFENENFFIKRKGELGESLSLGDLLTDAEYGIFYHLDESVPRSVKKRYALELTRFKIRGLLDKQIFESESESNRDRSFANFAERVEIDREKNERFGMIAEKMVRTFLTKMTWDYPNLEFEIEPVDAYTDMLKTIDFIIHVKTHQRGVKVEDPKNIHNAGIQFTINTNPEKLAHKRDQVAHVKPEKGIDDVILIQMSGDTFEQAFYQWEKFKTSGGPDRFWDKATKEKIFRNVLKGTMSEEEIEEQWIEVGHQEQEARAA